MLPDCIHHFGNLVSLSGRGGIRCGWALAVVCLAAGFGACLVAPDAYAQNQPAQPSKTPSLADLSIENSGQDLAALSLETLLTTKVSTASKKPETLAESPAAVFVVDRNDIYRYGYRTLADALSSIVGLYISSSREFELLGIRGYSRSGDFNGRFLLLVDGHRVNDPIYGTGTIGEDCPVDIEDIERIEVVKGPGSALWGTNALLAVVNIITKTAKDVGGTKLQTDGEKSHAEYGGTLGKNADVVVSATGLKSTGQKRIYFPDFDSPDTNNGIAENADGLRSTHARFAVSHEGLRFAFNRGVRNKVLPTAPYGTIFNDTGTTTSDARKEMELSYESKAGGSSGHSVFARVYSDSYDYVGYYAYDSPAPRTISRETAPAKWWGGEMRFSDVMSDQLSLMYGAEYMRTGKSVQQSEDLDPYHFYWSFAGQQTVRSYYTQASYQPSDLLHFTLGTRYDHYSSFGGNWSPRAALIYSPSRNTSIKALYGNAFRAPNFYELSWADSDTQLQPEKIVTRELVWEQQIGVNSRLVASLFQFDITDIINYDTGDDGSYMSNHGSARSGGFEMQYEMRPSYGVRGYAGLSVTRTSASDTSVVNSPNYVLTCGLSVPVHYQRYYISPQIRTIGRVFTYEGERLGPRTEVDLTLSTDERRVGTNVSLAVYNLLGTTTYAPGPSGRVQDTIPQPARTVRLTVSRGF